MVNTCVCMMSNFFIFSSLDTFNEFLPSLFIIKGFADGIEIMVLNLIMKSFEDERNLTKFQKGMIVSSAFIGIFIATLAISKNKDVFWRKPFIILGLILTMIFGFLSSLAKSCYELVNLQTTYGN